uniref:Glycosyltransferase n=1 Tax=viral metagenome TaxID=1070528 RepID=A0A6M3IND6_9ZZZZ
MKKIAVVVPWDTPFIWTAPAFNMMNWVWPEDHELRFIMGVGWCPAARHNDGVAKAQEWKADYIMFNGADHLCPFDIVERMMVRINEGWDIIQAVIPSRGVCSISQIPFDTLSYKIVGPMKETFPLLNADRNSIQIIRGSDEPQQAHVCGTGNILMKSEIFNKLDKPYFQETVKNDGLLKRWAIMDSNFVYKCTSPPVSAKMFCDTSIKLVHLDVFGIDESYSERFKDKTGMRDWGPSTEMRKFV